MKNSKRNMRLHNCRVVAYRKTRLKKILSLLFIVVITSLLPSQSNKIFGNSNNEDTIIAEDLIINEEYKELGDIDFDIILADEQETSAVEAVEVDIVSTPAISNQEVIENNIGDSIINVDEYVLERYNLPNAYYSGLDYSSFQPFMDYRTVSNRNSPAYKISHSEYAYTDENGLRRHKVEEGQISIDGKDDYIIALGTYYKEKGTAGSRYLIVTSTGMYTAITGDEKSDYNTDSLNMYSSHGNGKAGLIEWIVDIRNLNYDIKSHGTITRGPVEELTGEILYIYKIN